ncbi:MAG: hypothetical protein J5771_05330 [Bacteroidales bacterium]|nr:hypothetical protein [Bacteroidales bacterium]
MIKTGIKYLLAIAFLAVFSAMLWTVYSFARNVRHETTCQNIDIQYRDDYRFVSDKDITDALRRNFGTFSGLRIDSLDLASIERLVDNHSAVLKSEAWTTGDGILHISITQRQPVMRFQKGDRGFYIDDRGFIFPLQKGHSARVPVVDGNIPVRVWEGYKGIAATPRERTWLEGMAELASFLAGSRTWGDSIVQMTVNEDGDLVLVPREGRERFIFGAPRDAAAKFGRIADYYKYVKPAKEEDWYRTVNVKYDGQLICRK